MYDHVRGIVLFDLRQSVFVVPHALQRMRVAASKGCAPNEVGAGMTSGKLPSNLIVS